MADPEPVVAVVVAGQVSYDSLSTAQQAAVRDESERLDAVAVAGLDFADRDSSLTLDTAKCPTRKRPHG